MNAVPDGSDSTRPRSRGGIPETISGIRAVVAESIRHGVRVGNRGGGPEELDLRAKMVQIRLEEI